MKPNKPLLVLGFVPQPNLLIISKIIGVVTMPKSISYHTELIESLKEPSEAAVYLEVVLEEGDPKMIKKAFSNVIEARGGFNFISDDIYENLTIFDKKLKETGEIEFSLLRRLLESLGLKVGVMVRPS
ncbi:DNA-binding protein [Dapis sp. BLCC M172]|uniref:helix-turn-helix domain-containing transcriptional regulator n=1 Tax=Dapis sp. BLCC M172 TaxID=2975281 RepID=UPI003CEA4191